jgi:flagellar biosynthesis/type III secretory pathway protein FliH
VHGSSEVDLVIRLNPDDLAGVKTRIAEHPDLAREAAAAQFVADPSVPSGGVRAETGAGRLHYDPREVLERICEEVRREASA